MLRTLTFILFLFINIFIGAQTDFQSAVNQFVNFSSFTNSSISIQVIDLSSGEILGEHNAKTAIPPASTVKLFSTATAYEILGSSYRPATKIYLDGPIENGVLRGNIIVKGEGDPTLGSKYFYENIESGFLDVWVKEISKLGIQSVQGQIISDASAFGYLGAPEDWTWGDLGNYYGAGPSGICIYDNQLNYYFDTYGSGEKTVLTKTIPALDSLLFLNNIVSANVSGDNSYIFGAPYSYDRLGTGRLPINRRGFMVKGSIPDPELQLAIEFYKKLQSHNILIENGYDNVRKRTALMNDLPDYSKLQLIYTNIGKTVDEIALLTNHKSVNLFAEQLLCLTGFAQSNKGSTDEGLNQLYKFWQSKIDTKGLYLKDGSGLSRSNAVAAAHFCELLAQMSKSINYANFKASLPIAGQTGTISSLCKNTPAQGRIFAKSGTMSRIKSYAGYAETLTGKKLGFAIIINNFNCSSSTTVNEIEKLMVAMVKIP
ncbi:MAG: D-alanyl-D-alanine carboxypeptidase [Bacteroidetes bacterium]|nr:D-alanyl-D-alanine carboxypeptidase [Bacteroidota bacterium]